MYWAGRIQAFLAAALLSTAFAAIGCEGCSEKPPEELPKEEPPKKEEPPPEPEDPLKEARERATKQAYFAGVHIADVARSTAGELEAVAEKPQRPRIRKNVQKEKETGKLSKAELNKVFAIHDSAMKKCYERVLKSKPGLMGKVRLELFIRSNGDVGSASVRGLSLKDDSVHSCMERQAKTMKFPEPKGGAVRVTKTYSFSPEF